MTETTAKARRQPIRALIGLTLALIVPLFPHGAVTNLLPSFGPLRAGEIYWWALLIVLLAYVLLIERRPLGSIGYRAPTWKSFAFGIPAGVLTAMGIVAIYLFLFPLFQLHMNIGTMNGIMNQPYLNRVFLVTRAAVVEETLFRGYAMARIEELTGSRALAAVVSCAAFTLAHLSGWGAAQLLIAGFGGAMFTVLYLWRRDLPGNIVAHWIADAAGFLTR